MPRIYVACLASYNNGRLHGEWLDLDDIDEVREGIAKVLRESPYPNVEVECPECRGTGRDRHTYAINCRVCHRKGTVPSAEEYAVHDYDGVPGSWGEHPDLEKLVEFARLYEEHGEAFALFVDDEGGEVDEERFLDRYQGTHDTEAAWAEQFLEDTGGLSEIPENLRYYFDFDAYARDARLNGDVTFIRGSEGLHVFWNH